MNTADYAKAVRIAAKVLGANHIKWFVCFGNLLHLIRDKSLENDKDVDIGVFYEHMALANPNAIVNGFEKFGYTRLLYIEHDIDEKPLYMCFRHPELPPIDIFCWFKHGKYRYHTFDTLQEKVKKRPSLYKFLGVPAKYLPDPDGRLPKDPTIVKQMFFQSTPQYVAEIYLPLNTGTLLDIWYPNWLKPRSMTSMSPEVVTMKSCRQWKDEMNIECQIDISRAVYQKELLQMV